MKKIDKMHGSSDEEVVKHLKAIEECIKKGRGKDTK